MNKKLVSTLISSIIKALIGVAIWGAVSYFFNFRLALIGIAIGFAVGKSFSKNNLRESITNGIIAVVITAAAILLGELFSLVLLVSNEYDVSIIESINNIDFKAAIGVIVESSGIKSIVVYGISLFYAYKYGSEKGIMTSSPNKDENELNEDIV